MKPLTWVDHAVQSLATQGTGHSGGIVRQREREIVDIEKEDTYRSNSDKTSYTPRSWPPRTPPALELRAAYNVSTPADPCHCPFEPESPPPLPLLGFDNSFADDLINARTEFDLNPSWSSQKDSGNYSDSEYSSTNNSAVQSKTPSLKNFLREVSSTVFQGTASVPIIINVTAPVEEIPDTAANPPVLRRNAASFPLMALGSNHFNDVNPSLLMPPPDNQPQSRKARKAQEFHKMRKWLITFLNSKGDEFPRKVRLLMMELYCIRENDLAPEIVAKFNAEVQDEAVALEQGVDVMDNAQSLSILGAVFRSQIEEMTTSKETVVPLSIPPSWSRQSSLPWRPESPKPKKGSRPTSPVRAEIDVGLVPPWLGPFISGSATTRDSILLDQQYLKRASSAPNLKGLRPHLTSTDSTHSVPGSRPRGSTVVAEDAQRKSFKIKRGSFISGAFGAMKNAMRKPSKQELQKKNCWDGR